MIKYINAVSPRLAQGMVAEVYGQIRREFGVLGEPLTLHSPLPDLLAGVWGSFRESLLAGNVPRAIKEAVAVAVSGLNRCPYCIDAHAVLLRATGSHEAASAVQKDQTAKIRDPKMRAVVEWAKATRSPGDKMLSSPPFSHEEAPELIGIALWIHYINRMTKIFLGGNLIPIRANILGLRSLSERMGGLFFSGVVNRRFEAGASLNLLKDGPLPSDFAWAAPVPSVARAFAAFSRAVEEAGNTHIDPAVRNRITESLKDWDGTDAPLGNKWIEAALSDLAPDLRPAGRLALLAALAPDRVDNDVIRDFRETSPGDATLLATVGWSGFAATRTIGTWLDSFE